MDNTIPVADDTKDSDRMCRSAGGVFEGISNLFASSLSAFSNFLELVTLEARRAGLALAWMIAMGIVAAVFIVAAWLGVMAGVAMWAVSLGLSPVIAVIMVSVANLLAAAVLIFKCIKLSQNLLFSATRRQVAGTGPVAPQVS